MKFTVLGSGSTVNTLSMSAGCPYTAMTLALMLLLAVNSFSAIPESRCRPASDEDFPHGANILVIYKERTVRKIKGQINFLDGPANDVVVEIFEVTDSESDLEPHELASSKGRRAACVTAKNGRFRFPDLSSGRYVLRAGTRKPDGFNYVHISITINKAWWKNWFSRGKELKLELSVGI